MDYEGSPGEVTVMTDQKPKCHRSTRSLNMLTRRFVKLLQEAEGGVLDLKEVRTSALIQAVGSIKTNHRWFS